jgi:S1-C subfamily serine protease
MWRVQIVQPSVRVLRWKVRSPLASSKAEVMIRLAARSALVATVLAVGSAGVCHADGGSTGAGAVVNCYDTSKGVVQKALPAECRGRIVTDAEALAIDRERRRYTMQSFKRPPPIVTGKRLSGVGTGFFVSADGKMITNHHVIDRCSAVSVSPASGQTLAATVAARLPGADLALLQVDTVPSGVADFADGDRRSDHIAVVGYPDQGIPPIRPLLTVGRHLGAQQLGRNFSVIKIEAKVRPGNSGGPLLDEAGHVIGVVFAKVDTPGVYKRTGKVVRDIGYAIPSRLVQVFLAAKGVPQSRSASTPTSRPDDLLSHAGRFVARVECWR